MKQYRVGYGDGRVKMQFADLAGSLLVDIWCWKCSHCQIWHACDCTLLVDSAILQQHIVDLLGRQWTLELLAIQHLCLQNLNWLDKEKQQYWYIYIWTIVCFDLKVALYLTVVT